MRKDDVIKLLRTHRAEFEAMGVQHICLFGSLARHAAGDNSDIDLVATFASDTRPGLKVVALRRRLESLLGPHIDVLRGLVQRPDLRREIEREGVYAF